MRVSKLLNDAQVRALGKLPGTHNVGGVAGLALQVSPSGAKSWVLRATIAGRVRWMGLGPFSHVSLAEARDLAAKARAAVRDGRDPVAEREAAKRALEAAERRALTFREATLFKPPLSKLDDADFVLAGLVKSNCQKRHWRAARKVLTLTNGDNYRRSSS